MSERCQVTEVGGARLGPEKRLQLWSRRERAAELHVQGKTYDEIAEDLQISKGTAWTDVTSYFRDAARFYRAPAFRERIGATYNVITRRLFAELDRLGDEREKLGDRLAVIDRLLKTIDGLRTTYGLSGDAAVQLNVLNLGATPAEAATQQPEWLRGASPEKLAAMRERILAVYRELPRPAVPGNVRRALAEQESAAQEAEAAAVVDPPPPGAQHE